MARRRFQSPKPFKEGQFWWLRIWDSNSTGSRKRQRIKLATADMPLREVQKIAAEKLRPANQGLVLTGAAMNFGDFVTDTYIPTYLPLLSSSTQDSYNGVISKYLKPEFSRLSLRDLTRLTVQQYFSGMAGTVPYPTISKIRDGLSSILRSAVDADYLVKNPLEGLRLPLDNLPGVRRRSAHWRRARRGFLQAASRPARQHRVPRAGAPSAATTPRPGYPRAAARLRPRRILESSKAA